MAPADSEVTNSKHAAYWLMQAAKQKHPDAIFELGLLFDTGARRSFAFAPVLWLGSVQVVISGHGVTQDASHALLLYKQAGALGSVLALRRLQTS